MRHDRQHLNIAIEPFTGEAFRPFGHEIAFPASGQRTEPGPAMQNLRHHAQAMINLTSRAPDVTPLHYTEMERHRFSSQAFIPIEATRYIIVVAPNCDDGTPDLAQCRAFCATGRQGVIYNADIWHCPLRVIDNPALFCVFLHRDGSDDEEFITLSRPIGVVV